MNASIRHAWFPPAIPKRKHELDRELDTESEWPSAYRALSGPGIEPRPAKRLRALEGGLAGLSLKARTELEGDVNATPIKINTNTAFLSANPSAQPPPITSSPLPDGNQIHDAPLDGEAEPYISSIYEWASPHTGGVGSSVASLPLRGEVSEVNTSDSDEGEMRDAVDERQQMNGRRGEGIFMQGEMGMPGYTVYEPELGHEKRKRDGDAEEGPEKKGKRTWYEPEKDRIVILDLDSSEDESMTRSPRRRRSAFSLHANSQSSSTRPRSQTEIQKDVPEYVINPMLLSHISPPGVGESKGLVSMPREDDPTKAVVLYKPVPWVTGCPSVNDQGSGEVTDIEEAASGPVSMEASSIVRDDDDAMDIDP